MSAVMSSLKYYSPWKRSERTLLTIVFLYALVNYSKFNVIYGLYAAITGLWGVDSFWRTVGYVAIAGIIITLITFIVRRWALALGDEGHRRSKMAIFLLLMKTAGVSAVLAIVILLAGKLFTPTGYFQMGTYGTILAWLWQVPVGYFIGTGLSWSVVDRQINGILPVNTGGGVDHDQGASSPHGG